METPSKKSRYKKMATASCLLILITLWMFYKSTTDTNFNSSYLYISLLNETSTTNNSNFLVFSSKCRIPNYNAFSDEIKPFYRPEKYFACNQHPLLSYVTRNENRTVATLHIDADLISAYSKNGVSCCYSIIERKSYADAPDDGINVYTCRRFKNNVTVTSEAFMVRCKDVKTRKIVYTNTHSVILITNQTQEKLDGIRMNASRVLSVLFVGIDSISRLNLIRTMPQTYRYLKENDWIEYKGYNKMGDNTFPNLMAIFTGKNESLAFRTCNPRKIGSLDKCNFIFFNYSAAGYVTAYAEDEAKINTFNYRKKGFVHPPTDYYLRPYAIATEQLKIVKKDYMDYCVGPESYGERILNAAKEFAITFKEHPYFGFFWMNSFSHNELNSPSRMDYKVRAFLRDITTEGILNDTFVIFLSDHGLRFGEIRYTATGWLEERLPYIFFSVPKWFQHQHPQAYANLIKNTNKLTTPYDVYMTLQDILVKSGLNNYTIQPAAGCPKCKSLFEEAASERSCEEAGISQHWCTCEGYKHIGITEKIVVAGVWSVIEKIEQIRQKNLAVMKNCVKYKLKRVINSDISDNSVLSYRNNTFLKFVFETSPYAVFEATVEVLYAINGSHTFVVQDGISRLNYYGQHAKCVKESYLQTYCYCH